MWCRISFWLYLFTILYGMHIVNWVTSPHHNTWWSFPNVTSLSQCHPNYLGGLSYQKLYTKTATKEAALLPVKSSSDDDSGFRHGFGAEASLPLTQSAPAVYIYVYIYTNFIKHNRHFMSTYFLLDPFEFPYYFYRIRGELIYVLSTVVCIPSTLGHHQGRIYYKSDVTLVLAYYYYVRASLPLKIMALAFKWVSIISVSS